MTAPKKPVANKVPGEFEIPPPDPLTRAMDQGEVARVTGVSRERVRQIEQKALRKLKHALYRKGLDFDDLL